MPRAVAETLRSDGVPPQDRVGDVNLLSRLRQELSRGAFHLARRTALTLVERSPDNAFYRAKLAAAYLGLGQIEDAARVVDESQTISAANLGDFLAVARSLFEDGEHQRAVAMARRLVAAEETAAGYLTLGRMLGELGRESAFEEAMARALELQPDGAEARLELAVHLTGRGAFGRAEEELRKVLAAYPAHVRALLAYGRVERARGRPRRALARLERAVALAPGFCDAHLELLELRLEQAQRSEAEEAFADLSQRCADPQTRARASEILEPE